MDENLTERRARIQASLEQRLEWVRRRVHALDEIHVLLLDMKVIAEAAAQPLLTTAAREQLDDTFQLLQQRIGYWEAQSNRRFAVNQTQH